MKKWFTDIFYSFPIQLVILHLRNNLLLIGLWLLIALLMTGTVAKLYGIRYLFITPEYLGEVNFWSYFFVGFAFGGFLMTWNLTTYLLDAHHFPFLASLERPFTKFCLNNFIVPLVFITVYFGYTIHFSWYYEYWDASVIFQNCLGFFFGCITLLMLSSIYFYYTNKDILSFLKIKKKAPNMVGKIAPGRRVPTVQKLKSGERHWRVDTYLNESLRPRIVRSVAHYDNSILLSVFKQNHVNALIVQLFGLVVLIILGLLIDIPFFIIPAGGSLFIFASVLVAITGAVTYWFHRWRISIMVLFLICINFITRFDLFSHKNKGYGMDYTQELVKYNYQALNDQCMPDIVNEDKANTINILNNWRKKFGKKKLDKPKMVVFCTSGGGMKATVWAMQVMQQADSLLNGDLFKHTTLITGASGGLMGAAYFRELKLQQDQGSLNDIYHPKYVDKISGDLLNSLAFTIVSNDLFLPWMEFESGGYIYRKDRGYIFEKQLNENTNNVFNKTLGDYKAPESDATIPLLLVTPSIVNDGRRLVISPQGVSYMTTAPIGVEKRNEVEIDAVDFGRLFANQRADNLRFTTALRMNATYPYILPNVYLPSEPNLEVMDAGFRDNYGIMSATRFIHVFKDWILNNTSGVVLIQVAGGERLEEISSSDDSGIIESFFNPLGIAGQILQLQDFEHDNSLGLLYDLLGKDNFDVVRFTYEPSNQNEIASMTFHLTKREKNDILEAFYLEKNQKSFRQLKRILYNAK